MASALKAIAKFKSEDTRKDGKTKDEKKKNSKKKRRNYGRTKRYVLCILTSKSNFFFLSAFLRDCSLSWDSWNGTVMPTFYGALLSSSRADY